MILEDTLGPHGDTLYNALMDAHAGLSETESHALNARLVLILANEVSDIDRLRKLLETAATET